MVFFAFIFNVNAQKNMNTSYSFNVANQDEQKVLKLYKDYFGKKENLVKGITVSLYQNHQWLSLLLGRHKIAEVNPSL